MVELDYRKERKIGLVMTSLGDMVVMVVTY